MTKMSDKEFQEIVSEIMHITQQYSNKDHLKLLNGDVLSYTGVRLAAMKAYLMEVKVDAHRSMLDAEIEADRQKAIAYKKALKATNATAAKDGKYDDEEYIKSRKSYVEAKVFYEQLKGITADTHDLIDSIKSRVIDLQGARRDERLG